MEKKKGIKSHHLSKQGVSVSPFETIPALLLTNAGFFSTDTDTGTAM